MADYERLVREIVAILDNGKPQPLDVKAGDRVLFSKYAGNDVTLDGTEYIIMREDDILGVL